MANVRCFWTSLRISGGKGVAVGEEQVLEALEFDASEVMVEIVGKPLRAAEGMRVQEAQKMRRAK